jgi:hypothetical protein
VTPAEITILRSLAEADVVTFVPEGHTAAALARFEVTLDSLREMRKTRWVELQVAEDKRRKGGHPLRKLAGRCMGACREAAAVRGVRPPSPSSASRSPAVVGLSIGRTGR